MKPREAKTAKEIAQLDSNNTQIGAFTIHIDADKVTIWEQENGKNATGDIVIPRAEFEQLVDWFNGVTP